MTASKKGCGSTTSAIILLAVLFLVVSLGFEVVFNSVLAVTFPWFIGRSNAANKADQQDSCHSNRWEYNRIMGGVHAWNYSDYWVWWHLRESTSLSFIVFTQSREKIRAIRAAHNHPECFVAPNSWRIIEIYCCGGMAAHWWQMPWRGEGTCPALGPPSLRFLPLLPLDDALGLWKMEGK